MVEFPPELTWFHEQLAREIHEDLSDVADFERRNGLDPFFRDYYSNWFTSGARLARTVNAALERRRDLPAFVERLKQNCGPHPRVLDVGCGYGSDALLLAHLGCVVVGVDPAADLISVAAHRVAWWQPLLGSDARDPIFIEGRLEDLTSLEPDSFDGALVSECLHHSEPAENALLALRTLVRDKGNVLVLESNGRSIANRLGLRGPRRGCPQKRTLYQVDGWYRLYGNENIRGAGAWTRLFRDCGFSVDRVTYTRHLIAELAGGSPRLDRLLCRLPGKSLVAIHVAFELTPS